LLFEERFGRGREGLREGGREGGKEGELVDINYVPSWGGREGGREARDSPLFGS